jgi:hypothetical protein
MRRIRENLAAYGGLACMLTLTAPGEDAGLIWDKARCNHDARIRCSGPLGCRVLSAAATRWNEDSRTQWRALNRVCKKRADAAIARLGATEKRGLLLYEWEIQRRGVWHVHFVVGMETPLERAWAFEYAKAMREVGSRYGFGFVDARPLRSPQPAEKAAKYVSKYLAKWSEDGRLEVTETVLSAGRTLLTYVSRGLTAQSGCTMRALRNARLVWAWREGVLERAHGLGAVDFFVALCLLESAVPARAP